MRIFKDTLEIREWCQSQKTLGFVPTMGALHVGHLELIRHSLKECNATLVSIFVNPAQFNQAEDLENYPRQLDKDIQLLKEAGVDALMLPEAHDLYSDSYRFRVNENKESLVLEGAHRPGHFEGVLTVMMKLLNLTGCHRCYMGEKDYQQLQLVRDMAESFFIPCKIVGVPTVREETGLALSSRNLLLGPNARQRASELHQALVSKKNDSDLILQLENHGFKVDYLEERWGRRLVAAEIDGVRLIDNV